MQERKHHILVIEDDERLLKLLLQFLNSKDYRSTGAGSVEEARDRIKGTFFDAFVVDVMLPRESGLDFVRSLKTGGVTTPCLVLTAMGEPGERLIGLESGADDYMTKPFSMEELLARMGAILRRTGGEGTTEESQYQVGKYIFKPLERTLEFNGDASRLTTKENDLLKLLCKNANGVLERNDALKAVWGDDNYFNGRSMDVYIAKLRKHLNKDEKIEIMNIHGRGFKLYLPE